MSTTTMTPVSQLSDAALSELFCVEVVGWKLLINSLGRKQPQNELGQWQLEYDFATSADAVLPWLEKSGGYSVTCGANYDQQMVTCVSVTCETTRGVHKATASSFPRAACIALLAAKGITEVES